MCEISACGLVVSLAMSVLAVRESRGIRDVADVLTETAWRTATSTRSAAQPGGPVVVSTWVAGGRFSWRHLLDGRYLTVDEPAVELVFGREFAPAADAVPILAGAFAVMCIGYLTGNVMLVMQRTRRQALIAAAGLVVNVAGNLILVPRYGFLAAAWMTLAEGVAA